MIANVKGLVIKASVLIVNKNNFGAARVKNDVGEQQVIVAHDDRATQG